MGLESESPPQVSRRGAPRGPFGTMPTEPSGGRGRGRGAPRSSRDGGRMGGRAPGEERSHLRQYSFDGPSEEEGGGVRASYLLFHPSVSVKLQCGGMLFSQITEGVDKDQVTNKVEEAALCVGMGKRGEKDKSFDFAMPVGSWVHIAIACNHSSNQVRRIVSNALDLCVLCSLHSLSCTSTACAWTA
jgi:hypothetical protein